MQRERRVLAAALCSATALILGRLALRRLRSRLAGEPLLVMSFGCVCLTARSLGTAGARTFAGPLDWIFSNPAIAAHIVGSGGEALLDRDEYFRVATGKVGHRTYSPLLTSGPKGQNRHGAVFNHHDPITSMEDRAYLRRCVSRMNAALTSPLPKLCALISLEKRGPVSDGDLDTLLAVLEQRCRPSRVELVAIKLFTPPHGYSLPSEGPPGVGDARQINSRRVTRREESMRNATLRVVELWCRGGLGPSALALTDPADRQDLLAAIFGDRATFDTRGMLVTPVLAPDPLGGMAGHRVGVAVGDNPHPQGAGRIGKFRTDGYMVRRVNS